jgi:hypothetical protein
MKDQVLGALVGFILGVALVAASLDNWSEISKGDTGWYVIHKGHIYKLTEVTEHE